MYNLHFTFLYGTLVFMGIITEAKLKSINQNHLPKKWENYTHNDFMIVEGKLKPKPMIHKRMIEPMIFIKDGTTENN